MRHVLLMSIAMLCCHDVGLTQTAGSDEMMMRIVTRDVNPGTDRKSFAAMPRTMYRVGNKLARIEEPANPETGLHLRVIVNHPDIWMVNLADKTAKHIKDPDPKGVFRAPLVMFKDMPDLSKNLEFGRELEFMEANKAKESGTGKAGNKEFTRYVLEQDAIRIVLLVDSATKQLMQIAIARDGKVVKAVQYDVYETKLKPDTELFKLPEGIKVIEAK